MIINKKISNLQSFAQENAIKYQSNKPFPNIYFDDFFDDNFLEKVLKEFPNVEALKEKINYTNPNEKKLATKGENQFGINTLQLVHFLNSEPFLQFLQTLTGIKETLIPDPYFEGGGFHEIKPGGYLKLHADFHIHKHMNLDRRLNILIYLNKDWKDEYGGHFELWEKDMSACKAKIAPVFNRLAMFSTTDNSWHGHPDPLNCPADRSRKSLALYYYSNGRPKDEISTEKRTRITTTFTSRQDQDNIRMRTYNTLVNFANDILPPLIVRLIKRNRNT